MALENWIVVGGATVCLGLLAVLYIYNNSGITDTACSLMVRCSVKRGRIKRYFIWLLAYAFSPSSQSMYFTSLFFCRSSPLASTTCVVKLIIIIIGTNHFFTSGNSESRRGQVRDSRADGSQVGGLGADVHVPLVRDLRADGRNRSITVKWSRPENNPSEVSEYQIRYKREDQSEFRSKTISAQSGSCECTLRGSIEPLNEYEIGVRVLSNDLVTPWKSITVFVGM